jgi:hypothetical protein
MLKKNTKTIMQYSKRVHIHLTNIFLFSFNSFENPLIIKSLSFIQPQEFLHISKQLENEIKKAALNTALNNSSNLKI